MIFLLDSYTFNYILKYVEPVRSRFRKELIAGSTFLASSMVHYQVTRYLQLKGATKQRNAYDHLIANWRRVELLNTDWDDASNLWTAQHRIGQAIDDADLLIAISALKVGATIVTNNTRHFNSLGVSLENWSV